MDAAQAAQQMQLKIMPQFQELGMEAFVIVGYLKDGEGKVHRMTFGVENAHPAYSDGMRPLMEAAAKWGAGRL